MPGTMDGIKFDQIRERRPLGQTHSASATPFRIKQPADRQRLIAKPSIDNAIVEATARLPAEPGKGEAAVV